MDYLAEIEEGRGGAPSLVLALIFWLPEDSALHAMLQGGREHYGWTSTRYMLAGIFDSIGVQTKVLGNWKGKPPKFPTWPTPKPKKKAKQKGADKKMSILDIHARLMGKGGGNG